MVTSLKLVLEVSTRHSAATKRKVYRVYKPVIFLVAGGSGKNSPSCRKVVAFYGSSGRKGANVAGGRQRQPSKTGLQCFYPEKLYPLPEDTKDKKLQIAKYIILMSELS